MIRAIATAWFCVPVLLAVAGTPQADLLRFTNGDQMHGSFLGIRQGPLAVWQREDVAVPVEFKTERIRHVVLRGARPRAAIGDLSHAVLVNGDRVPASISGLDATALVLDTTYAGQLRIPRAQLAMLAVHPLGGRMRYHGPFEAGEWQMIHSAFPAGLPAAGEDKDDNEPGRWEFSGAAWHWPGGPPGTALIRKDAMPEQSLLRFDLAWKNRLSLTLAFHADFAPVKQAEDADKARAQRGGPTRTDNAEMARLFGNSHVLQIYSNYLLLMRSTVDADGKPGFKRVQHQGSHVRLGDSGRARIELRSNRRTGAITLFVDDEFAAQWGETSVDDALPDGEAPAADALPAGSGVGFLVHAEDAPVRISDIVLAEWNGMPDSARSMQVDDQDVVLMTNGTDRYAGRVDMLDAEGRILFEGRHGRFQFPLEDVAEIRFARQRLAAAPEPPAGQVAVRFAPIGRISGTPLAGSANQLTLLSPLLGELSLNLDPAVMIDFNASNLLLDDWDADF